MSTHSKIARRTMFQLARWLSYELDSVSAPSEGFIGECIRNFFNRPKRSRYCPPQHQRNLKKDFPSVRIEK